MMVNPETIDPAFEAAFKASQSELHVRHILF
jgi:hypothetical protein